MTATATMPRSRISPKAPFRALGNRTKYAFRDWLGQRYNSIDRLNEAWDAEYESFDDISSPMWLTDAADEHRNLVAFFDHRRFMNEAFIGMLEDMADAIEQADPRATVGFKGLQNWQWQSGYDHYLLTRRLRLNQVHTHHFPQGDLIRSFAEPGALRGQWTNAIAEDEHGFAAIPWHNLFMGHNSVWWWRFWGHAYTPFLPDGSLSYKGRAFFDSLQQIQRGPGRLLQRAQRDDSRIAIIYNVPDIFAGALAEHLNPDTTLDWQQSHGGLIRALDDLGYSHRHVDARVIAETPEVLDEYEVLCLPLATALDDAVVEAVQRFARDGGTVLADGRAAILTADGLIREDRPLDSLFGIYSPAGRDAVAAAPMEVDLPTDPHVVVTHALEPGISLAGAESRFRINDKPLMLEHAFGEGRGVLTNFSFGLVSRLRNRQHREVPILELLDEVLRDAGLRPHAELRGRDGRARNSKLSRFHEGALQYLGVEQDISRNRVYSREIPVENVTLQLAAPAYVYDIRKGELVGDGDQIASWPLTLSRGNPHLFAIMPYRVEAVDVHHAETHEAGAALDVKLGVQTSEGSPGFHALHLRVYEPDSDQPHRQYSRTVDCPGGSGLASIPFAFSDAPGIWRIEITDAATGVATKTSVELQNSGVSH